MLNYKPKLSPNVLRKFEPKLELFCFYNAKNKTFWNCDFPTGTIIANLDGTLEIQEILEIILTNNKNIDQNKLKNSLLETFEILLNEEFLINAN